MTEKNGGRSAKLKLILIGVVVVIAIAVLAVFLLNSAGFNVPGDYRTIQEAIDAAKDGDVIVVEPGVYYERIDFMGKNITIRSTDPEDFEVVAATVIDGRRRGSVVTFNSGEGSGAVLKGFTITGGVGTFQTLTHEYGGEEVVNEGNYGGGILIDGGSSPTITNNIIRDNGVNMDGGGVAVLDGSNPIIEDNTIEGNSAFSGGGIVIWRSNPILENNEIKNNQASYLGGAILVDANSTASVSSNTIYNNEATSGGGIAVWHSEPLITDNNIYNNVAIWFGGGIAMFDSSPVIDNNQILRNNAINNGGGVAVVEKSAPVISNNTINRNFTEENGGGIAVTENSSAIISDNEISDNAVLYGGGGIYVDQSAIQVNRTNISGNLVQQDGAGIAAMNGSTVIINSSTIENNSSGNYGGGLALGEGSSAEIEDTTIAGNEAFMGGGIFVQQSGLLINLSFITGNKAGSEAIGSGSGGGIILVLNSIGEILNTVFSGNNAFEFGGGLVAYDGSQVLLSGNEFIANVADTGGAFIGFGEASIDLPEPDDNNYSDNVPEDIDPSLSVPDEE